jgi:hypothetical protein
VKAAAGLPPKVTAVAPTKFVPMITTEVPPAVVPVGGAAPLTAVEPVVVHEYEKLAEWLSVFDTEIDVKPLCCRNKVPPELVMAPEFAPDTVAAKEGEDVEICTVSPASNNKDVARDPELFAARFVEAPLQPTLAACASPTIVVQSNADANNRRRPRDATSSPRNR